MSRSSRGLRAARRLVGFVRLGCLVRVGERQPRSVAPPPPRAACSRSPNTAAPPASTPVTTRITAISQNPISVWIIWSARLGRVGMPGLRLGGAGLRRRGEHRRLEVRLGDDHRHDRHHQRGAGDRGRAEQSCLELRDSTVSTPAAASAASTMASTCTPGSGGSSAAVARRPRRGGPAVRRAPCRGRLGSRSPGGCPCRSPPPRRSPARRTTPRRTAAGRTAAAPGRTRPGCAAEREPSPGDPFVRQPGGGRVADRADTRVAQRAVSWSRA